MNCLRPCDGGDVDDVLANAKAVLERGKATSATSPIHGLSHLTEVLISLIDGVSVRGASSRACRRGCRLTNLS